jgi:lipopolysaccharide/colanic/teichoic acid biosynthesis glycosyltransferase
MLRNETTSISKVILPEYIHNRNSMFWFALKRIVDVAFAASLLVILAPLMLIIAVLIKLDSRGGAFFIQERVGARPVFKNGRLDWEIKNFRFFKFRSMAQNADQGLHQAHIQAFINGSLDTSEGTVKLTNDPRVTRIGAFLRKTSLDELPQLFNVLRGEMSLVGPRPVPTYEVEGYQPWHYERLNAMPGITGLWQVKGRGIVSFEDMIRMDIEYVRTRTLWSDIKILFLTFAAVFSCRGAK